MINLIPPHAKKSLRVEYWVRVCSVWMVLWSVALLACTCVLFPTYVLVGSQVDAYEASAAEASMKVARYGDVSSALVQSSLQAKMIIDESSLPKFSDYISLFEGLQGAGIRLSQVDLNRESEGITPIRLVGEADNRQELASFRDRLEDGVGSVDLPLSNLTGDKDINFSLTVTLDNESKL